MPSDAPIARLTLEAKLFAFSLALFALAVGWELVLAKQSAAQNQRETANHAER